MSNGERDPGWSATPSSDGGAPVPARDPFVRRTATVIALVGAAALLGALFVLGIDILLAGFGGILFAVLLVALRDGVQKIVPLPDGWALTAGIVAASILIGGIALLLTPQVSEQASEVGQQLPGMLQDIEGELQRYEWGQWVLEQAEGNDGGEQSSGSVVSAFSVMSDWATYLLTAFFVGIFAAAKPQLYRDGVLHLFPIRHRDRIRVLLDDLGHTLRWWLIGQALAMLVIGVSTTIVLLIFGIPFAIVLGLIVGLLGFIPYLGPIMGAVPVALVAATEGASTLLYVMTAYVVVQTLEGYVATPLIQRKTVYLPPVFTIITQILLGTVLGLLGFILATPLAAALLVLTRFYRTDILGDEAAAKS